MPQTNIALPKPDAAALNAAFAALETYDQGSSRGVMLPIDHAVRASLDDKAARLELEQRLAAALKNARSAAAGEYLCSKLALIGSELSVPAIAPLLGKPEFATAARNALEAIPGAAATKALRDALLRVEGVQKVGVVHSLGARRDADSVPALIALLKSADTSVAGAAVAALGDSATSKAAKALLKFQPNAPQVLQQELADAILNCAEPLLTAGDRRDARQLFLLLATSTQPKHVQQAAARGLASCAGPK